MRTLAHGWAALPAFGHGAAALERGTTGQHAATGAGTYRQHTRQYRATALHRVNLRCTGILSQ